MIASIAESINIMGKRSGGAMKERNPGPVQEMAKEEAGAGATYIDLNIGSNFLAPLDISRSLIAANCKVCTRSSSQLE